jgi:beta-glucanase (GH16 family)
LVTLLTKLVLVLLFTASLLNPSNQHGLIVYSRAESCDSARFFFEKGNMNSSIRLIFGVFLLGLGEFPPAQAQTKTIIWQEEFDYRGLPDSTRWGYEVGYIRNREQQYYTKARLENVQVDKGSLVITTRKERYDTMGYTAASINTLNKQHFDGDIRVDVRARLPRGAGIWPAIWMMGVSRATVGWPRCGEIDLMEYVGHTPGTVWGTVHWWDSTATNALKVISKGGKRRIRNLHRRFHLFRMERRGGSITLTVDKKRLLNFAIPDSSYPNSLTQPLYLLLNTAVGGSWGGKVDDTIFPQRFYIDFVRVYRLEK